MKAVMVEGGIELGFEGTSPYPLAFGTFESMIFLLLFGGM